MKTKYFSREEFKCKCGCGLGAVDAELLFVLTKLRERFNRPVILNSAHRCNAHNSSVGGEIRSKHLEGIAADVVVRSTSPSKIYEYLNKKYPNKYGIGLYSSFVHIDMRAKKTRWSG